MKSCSSNIVKFAFVAGVLAFLGGTTGAQPKRKDPKPTSDSSTGSIATFSTEDIAREGIFYAGGQYVGEKGKETMGGDAYVVVWVPKQIKHPYPIVYVHGAGQTATDWEQTPDGRPGWAYYFAKQGYVQYMVDSPARGRSPYVPGIDGNLNIRTAPNLEEIFTASEKLGKFPRAQFHNQFPGTGLMGDPIFDNFAKTQVQFLGGGGPVSQDELTHRALVALLDAINSPVILLTHSQGGTPGWLTADSRPNLVKAIVTIEPAAPPIHGVDTATLQYTTGAGGLTWGVASQPITYDPPVKDPAELKPVLEAMSDARGDVVPCYLQTEPAHKLINLENIPVVYLSAEGGYHREYDPCLAKWLLQAGVRTEFVPLESVGIHGNGHEMMLEKNSDDIAKFIGDWMAKRVPEEKVSPNLAMPPSWIPTFSTENIARQGFYYAGGKYLGEKGKEVMGDAMYTEVWVPKQVKHPYPVVFFHGNGQSGAVWRQTPDGRAGWAYYMVAQGYTVYMVDYPARGRSGYVPGSTDGRLGIRTALDLETIWTAPVTSGGNFPRMALYTQWPSDSPKKGMMGDPIFDNFAKGQLQFVSNQEELTIPAGDALLDAIGKPVILLSHSQGGGMGFMVADQRPKLVAGMVAIEPGGPQIGNVDTAKVEYTRVNPNSWGIGNMPMHFDPPITNPSELKVHPEGSERPDEVACYLQDEPVHKLSSFVGLHILSLSAEGTYHRVYDPCIPKWLNQAGAKDDFIRLESVGIRGNMHEMFLDRNSDEIIHFIDDWLNKNVNNTTK